MLTSLTVLVARSALFQRKSRSGFLDELDDIRSDALDSADPEGDLWTDLREGGEYSDPHEIADLYADDSTPDLPTGKHSAARRPDRKPPRRDPPRRDPDPGPVVADTPPPPPPPPPPSPTPVPVEAAPHPVRPSEMWHSADGAPTALGEQLAPIETAPMESASFETASLAPAVSAPSESAPPTPIDPFEADAPEVPAGAEPIVEFTSGLVPGPVGRRNRRDRPASRRRAPLTPASDVPTPEVEAEVEVEAEAEAEVSPESSSEEIVPSPDGMVGVSGALVRVAPDFDGEVRRRGVEVTVVLRQGWCWVAPGEGDPIGVEVELPNSRLVAEGGSTVLSVVEPDGSAFVIVAAGSTTLGRGDDVASLQGGSIVMIDPSGVAQTDQAEPPEIEADPLVSVNLALDAEL